MYVPTGNTLPALLLARPGGMGLWQLHLYKLKDLGAPWQAIQVQSIVFLECSPQESVAHNSRAQQAEGSFKLDQSIKFEEYEEYTERGRNGSESLIYSFTLLLCHLVLFLP